MSERTNTDVLQQGYEAFGRGDIPAVLDLLTDDVEWIQQGPSVSLLPALATDTRESRSTSPGSMKTSNLSSSSLASSSPKATPSSSWGLSVVSARRRATRSSKSGHTSTRSGMARSPRCGILKTQRHKLPRFIVVGFERSVSVGRAGVYNVSALLVVLIHPSAWKGDSRNFASGGLFGRSKKFGSIRVSVPPAPRLSR